MEGKLCIQCTKNLYLGVGKQKSFLQSLSGEQLITILNKDLLYLAMTSNHAPFRETLQQSGMRLTPQKQAIYAALMESVYHPSAEELYDKVKVQFPNMSLATVYDNVKKFLKLGLCTEIYDQNGVARFDGNMHAHHHVINSQTGEIHDVYVPNAQHIPLPSGIDPNAIKEIRITYIT